MKMAKISTFWEIVSNRPKIGTFQKKFKKSKIVHNFHILAPFGDLTYNIERGEKQQNRNFLQLKWSQWVKVRAKSISKFRKFWQKWRKKFLFSILLYPSYALVMSYICAIIKQTQGFRYMLSDWQKSALGESQRQNEKNVLDPIGENFCMSSRRDDWTHFF